MAEPAGGRLPLVELVGELRPGAGIDGAGAGEAPAE